jgi:hypothetical protein
MGQGCSHLVPAISSLLWFRFFSRPPSFYLCKMIQRKFVQKTVSKLKSCYGTYSSSSSSKYNDFTVIYCYASKGCRGSADPVT